MAISKQREENMGKVMLETLRHPSDEELEEVSDTYRKFYKWRDERSGTFRQFQGKDFEGMLAASRNIFWNSTKTPSEDLQGLGLDFSIPFVRKEVKDFIGKLTTLSIKPRLSGDDLDVYGVKVLQAIYDKWRMHSNDRVEKFWELLYGIVNGTVCKFIGYNDAHMKRRYLREYDMKSNEYRIEEKDSPYWNDVWGEIVPIEDIYLPKIYERNIRKQGELIWKTQIGWKDFKREFGMYDNAEYVYPGNRLSDDSLYFKLLGGSGVTTTDKVEVLKRYDEIKDKFIITANGVWLNPMGKKGKEKSSPLPFNHKHLPFVWGILDPIDEKLAYGMPAPFNSRDTHKLLNTTMTMLLEHELRFIDRPFLTSDIEAPDLIFGDKKVIPVNDVNAYKEIEMGPVGQEYFATMNTLQGILTSQSQGGMQMNPSRQPRSAREEQFIAQQQQVFLANTILMYYDMLRQEIELVLKTAIQFYPMDKYRVHSKNLVRAINVPNTALTAGGMGTIEVRLVKKKATPVELLMEAIQKSILNGRQTEIIEAPIEAFEELEFDISRIELEQEKTTEIEQAAFVEKILMPMTNVFMQMGLVDPQKLMLRYLEKMKEHPADYVPDKVLPQMFNAWNKQYQIPPLMPTNLGRTMGSLNQSNRGIQFGGTGNQGMGRVSPPFGAQGPSPLPMGGQ